jgi:hypothetical protein
MLCKRGKLAYTSVSKNFQHLALMKQFKKFRF